MDIDSSDTSAPFLSSVFAQALSGAANDEVKVSLRSKEYVNVAELAHRHGGGGHKHAAGFTLEMNLKEAKKVVRQDVEKVL